ncbi:hypothetical protein PO124_12960 [Bacillus licheniformis]|nr:hypothetical protein [Bacillus licheniformis]
MMNYKKRHVHCKQRNTKPEMAQFWDDIGAYLDFTKRQTFDWWKAQVTESCWNTELIQLGTIITNLKYGVKMPSVTASAKKWNLN